MSELLPCPFCGGEAEIRTCYNHGTMSDQKLYRIRCKECKSGQAVWSACLQGRPHGAVEAWNTRAERTCRNTQSDFDFMCSECHACIDNGRLLRFNYCPRCGAKVVDK